MRDQPPTGGGERRGSGRRPSDLGQEGGTVAPSSATLAVVQPSVLIATSTLSRQA
ncbi:MAG: hypothetical protein ACOYD4_12815 [Solirubrobacterales bacterium]